MLGASRFAAAGTLKNRRPARYSKIHKVRRKEDQLKASQLLGGIISGEREHRL